VMRSCSAERTSVNRGTIPYAPSRDGDGVADVASDVIELVRRRGTRRRERERFPMEHPTAAGVKAVRGGAEGAAAPGDRRHSR